MLSFALAGTAEPIKEPGKYLWVVRRQADGAWRIATDIWNSSAPLVGPAK